MKQQVLQAAYELERLEKSYVLDQEEYKMGVKSKAQLEVARMSTNIKKKSTALQLEGLQHDSTVTVIRKELMQGDLEREKKKNLPGPVNVWINWWSELREGTTELCQSDPGTTGRPE